MDKLHFDVGVYEDVPFETYVKIDGINHSKLKKFAGTSPYHYKWAEDNNVDDDKDHLSLGRKVHKAVLEPDLFNEQFIVEPEDWKEYEHIYSDKQKKELEKNPHYIFDGRRTVCKMIRGAHDQKVKKLNDAIPDTVKQPLYQSMRTKEHKEIICMKESVLSNEVCWKIIKGGQKELTIVWIDEKTGLKCKARLDVNSQIKGFLADLKTTKSCNPKSWERDMVKYGYHSGAAFYMDGAKAVGLDHYKTIIWMCVETEEPYYVQPFFLRANSSWLELGRQWYRQQIERLHYCMSTDTWNGYYDSVNNNYKLYEIPEPQWV